tara:strand:- start:17368 stop:18078 length:711 start_codon:yes stop_codon:yes gene_type:complete
MKTKTKNINLMLSETLKHYNADQVMQGQYWDAVDQKGCFIGCLTHDDDAQGVTNLFGIELPLVKLLESIYEGLEEEESKEFFKAIPVAIGKDGRDLSLVKWAFLRDTLKVLQKQDKEIQAVIDLVIEGMTILADGGVWHAADYAAANAANAAYAAIANAALAAAYYAEAAAYYAEAAADAAAKAYANTANAYVADATNAAFNAAYAAARSTDAATNAYNFEYKRQAASILALLSAA